jgi:DNA polymerase-4
MGFRRTGHDVKSVGNEQTFLQDIVSLEVAQKELLALGNQVAQRMRHKRLKGKTITLKVKYFDFVQIMNSGVINQPLKLRYLPVQNGLT